MEKNTTSTNLLTTRQDNLLPILNPILKAVIFRVFWGAVRAVTWGVIATAFQAHHLVHGEPFGCHVFLFCQKEASPDTFFNGSK